MNRVTGLKRSFVSLSPRPGVKQGFELIVPGDSIACVVLFAGGPGVLGISDDGGMVVYGRDINFLVRSRELFAAHGLVVAVVDAPSDRNGKRGMLGGFRNGPEHLVDIDAVVEHLRALSGLPVWLVGTSRGTESATHVAIHGKAGIAGLVLTASVTVPDKDGMSVTEMALDKIKVPTQVLTHYEDGCYLTPPAGTRAISDRLVNAPKIDVGYFLGGREPESGPCDPLCEHGFFGIEGTVVARTADFIRSCLG